METLDRKTEKAMKEAERLREDDESRVTDRIMELVKALPGDAREEVHAQLTEQAESCGLMVEIITSEVKMRLEETFDPRKQLINRAYRLLLSNTDGCAKSLSQKHLDCR